MNTKVNLPIELKDILCDAQIHKINLGYSKAVTLFCRGIRSGENAYLKINIENPTENLLAERNVLNWLRGRLPVPRVLYYDSIKNKEYLLLSEVEGTNASEEIFKLDKQQTVAILAEGLKSFHKVDISDCPFDLTLNNKIAEVRLRIELNLVDEKTFEDKYSEASAKDLFEQLLEKKPDCEDIVLTHGDYCMPNVIIIEGKISGFIDVGRAGIADRYQDLATMLKSLAYNGYPEKLRKTFINAYDLSEVDLAKIEFYRILDEFF